LFHFTLLLSGTGGSRDHSDSFLGRAAATALEGNQRTREIADVPATNTLIFLNACVLGLAFTENWWVSA